MASMVSRYFGPFGRTERAVLKNRILCSRPFLALHVLMGKPVLYRATLSGLDGNRNAGARVVDCMFDVSAAAAPKQ
jgi:hypothetical protein